MRLIVMSTRREPQTVYQTITSILASGWPGKVIISIDPESAEALSELKHHERIHIDSWDATDWKVVKDYDIKRRTGWHYACCLQLAAEDPEGGVILEDDVVLRDAWLDDVRELIDYSWLMNPFGRFTIALYSRYDPVKTFDQTRSLQPMPEYTFYGTQAMYWPAQMAGEMARLMRRDVVDASLWTHDLYVAHLADVDPTFQIILPESSVAQHVGRVTTGWGAFHSSPTFDRGAVRTSACMVTAGIGPVWKERARRVALRFRELNPWVSVRVIDEIPAFVPELPCPSWVKLWAWEVAPPWTDTLIWLDADIVPVRSFDSNLPRGDFVGVEDVPISARMQSSRIQGWDTGEPYINMGFWIAKRASRPAFEITKQLLARGASKWVDLFWEQGWLNYALQIARVDIKLATSEYNWMPGFGPYRQSVVQIHDAGGNHHRLEGAWKYADTMRNTVRSVIKPVFVETLPTPSAMRVKVYRGHDTVVKQPPLGKRHG